MFFIMLLIFFSAQSSLDSAKLELLDNIILTELSKEEFSGTVVLIGDKNGISYHKSFGNVNKDTLFDLASLTKIFTALSILILQEKKLINIESNVKQYLPDFKYDITVKQLLLHISGLPEANSAFLTVMPADDFKNGKNEAIKKICDIPIGKNEFTYSCVGYILLGFIIEAISGLSLDQFVKENIFDKLDMNNTCYNPNGRKVHDPRSAALNGVAGNAGIFSTALDLSKICSLIINNGTYNNQSILSKKSINSMVDKYDVGDCQYRGLGWDIKTKFSGNIGNFSLGTIGQVGFTGTSIVIDLESTTFVIILTNRLGMGNKSIWSLRKEIANLVHSIVYSK